MSWQTFAGVELLAVCALLAYVVDLAYDLRARQRDARRRYEIAVGIRRPDGGASERTEGDD